MSSTLTVHLRLICHNPPLKHGGEQPVIFGLQDKDRALHPGQFADDGSLVFECTVTAVPQANGTVNIRGNFAHGPADARYDEWIRRIKIPLSRITWEQASSGKTLEAAVDGQLVSPRDEDKSCRGRFRRETELR
jgi:hypothetical protein